ncbi:GNAT family N-acetyltransferase [Shewanella sp. AS1]|uniref:GNAT family N-acetyltransferase n=1 Tax=Shewanella sp. AS1 TaxID=2907626 RepID=UPI001F22CFE5|nr:GNAT family N-acetyltransferase [Shewanella sp. AS1]MCE9678093.1 GNAT family N-acetyltransferase [Shewanella sp. AS1]
MVSIRKAVRADVTAVFTIRRRAILDKCSGFYSDKQLALWTQGDYSPEFAKDVADNFYVAQLTDRLNSKVIASGKLSLETGVIDAIFVDPDFFGQGVARSMLQHLERLALDNGINQLSLDSTLNAAPFYRRCGFIGNSLSTYHSPTGISLDCIPMHKQLK